MRAPKFIAAVAAAALTISIAGEAYAVAAPAEPFPTFVHLPADQAAHPGAAFEWWYTVGHLTGGAHQFGYEMTLTFSGGVPETHIAITDQTTGRYYQHVQAFRADQASESASRLDVRMPAGRLSGPMDDMSLSGTLPAGSLSLRLRDTGPALYVGGAGLIPFLGGQSYYYSLPRLATSGTLNGTTFAVTGLSWLDRQWGNWDWRTLGKWTWMAIQLDNGASLNMFDVYDKGGEHHYATVLYRDGAQAVVPVTPLAAASSGFWTSPVSGQRYATRWVVTIPHLDATLRVRSYPAGQEVMASYPGITPSMFEGASAVTGTWAGADVTGAAYVEQLGHWK